MLLGIEIERNTVLFSSVGIYETSFISKFVSEILGWQFSPCFEGKGVGILLDSVLSDYGLRS